MAYGHPGLLVRPARLCLLSWSFIHRIAESLMHAGAVTHAARRGFIHDVNRVGVS